MSDLGPDNTDSDDASRDDSEVPIGRHSRPQTVLEESTSDAVPGIAPAVPVDNERRQTKSWTQRPRRVVLLYTGAFVASEALGAYAGIQWQIGLTALLLLVALNHALFGFRNERTAAVVMSALFTSRLVVLTLPITDTSIAVRAAVIAAFALLISRLAIWVMTHDVVDTRAVEGFPLKRPIFTPAFTTAVIAFSGVPFGVAAYYLLDPAPLNVDPLLGSLTAAWALIVLCLAFAASSEELLYRQLVAAMVQHTGASQTGLISGLLFGAIYLGTNNPAFAGLAFVVGTVFAWSCERTGSLRGPVIAHIIISVLVFVILPSTGLPF